MQQPIASAALAALATLVIGACTEAAPIIEATTVLEATTDTVGPYEVQAIVVGIEDQTDQIVELRYRIDDELRFVPLVMTADDSGERFHAAIPGRPAGTVISYYVAVFQDGERLTADPDAAGAQPYRFEIRAP